MRAPTTALLATLVVILLTTSAEALAASGELSPAAGIGWQSQPSFLLDWEPIAPANPSEAAYRLYDSGGTLVKESRRSLNENLTVFTVPATPDAYKLEAWLGNEAGQSGPHSTTTLRFDNAKPPLPRLDVPSGWVLGTEPVILHVDRPTGALPISGISGFAISSGPGKGNPPCAQPDRCLAADVDLGEGAGPISLGTLPEGTHSIRVVTVSGAGVASAETTASVRVDASSPLLSLDGAPAGWSNRPVRATTRATDALSGMAAAGALGPFTAIAADGAPPTRALGDAVSAWVGGSGIHTVESFARDAAGNVGTAGTATIRIDEDPPRVAFAVAQDPTEPERIEATVSDPLSGPSPDRGSIGIRAAGTRARFEQLPTRNAGDRLVARWDSDSYPPGKYELVATGYDAAGNAASGSDRLRGGRMVLVNPLKAPAEIEARLSRRRLIGRLRRTGGGPIAGQEVAVTETFAGGSEPQRRTTVIFTDRQGTFSLRLGPGPSRDVVAGFVGTALLSRAASRAVHLDAATQVRLRASMTTARIGGKPVVFSGTVANRGAATVRGLPVELQFRFRGGTWSGFRTVEADSRGRFRYRYRFSDDDSRGIRFQFRAHVKGREGWPYGPGTSRPVQVKGV